MMKSFGISSGSEDMMGLAMGQRPDSALIDSASQANMNPRDVSGESAPAPTNPAQEKESSVMGYMAGGLLGGGKGLGETMNGVKGGAQGVMKFVDDNPVLTEVIATGASIAFPPAAPAIQGAKRGIQAVNMADNMTGGHIKGSGEDMTMEKAESIGREGLGMLQGDATFQEVNQSWSQSTGMSVSERVNNTVNDTRQKQTQSSRSKQRMR